MPFALELPFRRAPAASGLDTPRRLRACLRSIAAEEPRDACRRLADLLAAQNQLALAPQRRLHLLEVVRPATRAPLDALAARVQAQSLPLPQRTRELAELNRELLSALIRGYETVMTAMGADNRASGRALALVTERLLATRAELLLRHVEVQEPLPTAFWQRANATYARAESTGAARRRVADRQWHGARRPTPTDAFVSLLLLALAHPRGLRPGEAGRIHRATQGWCRDAILGAASRPPADAQERGSVFAVALDAVTAPAQWRQRAGEARAQERVLDLARVVARVERLHAEALAAGRAPGSAPDDEDSIGPTGLKRLLDNWNPRPLAHAPQPSAGQPAEVVVGLAALQQRLQDAEPAANVALRAERARHYTHLPENVLQTIAPDEPGNLSHGYPHARAAAEAARPAAADAAPASADWLLEEADAAGFRLRWQGVGRSGATVGELVAFRVDGAAGGGLAKRADGARWRVGVVRWLQFIDDDHFAIGCELLSPRPRAATVRHEPTNRHRRSALRGPGEAALLLPGADGGAQAASVLLPAHGFHAEEIVELDAGERTVRVQLTAMREHSAYFALYALAPAPARGRTAGLAAAATSPRSLAG